MIPEAGEASPVPDSADEVRLDLLIDAGAVLPRGFGPARAMRLIWHDDEQGALAAAGLALSHDGATWRLERLVPTDAHDWPACRPPAALAEGTEVETLALPAVGELIPVGGFEGTIQLRHAGAVEMGVLAGEVRGIAEARPVSRLQLRGPGAAVVATLPTLAPLGLGIPRASLAREAMAAARAEALPARHLGAPSLDGSLPVGDGLAAVVSHLVDALLFWTDVLRRERRPEAVHQARVATRRLRSALSIYRPVASAALAGLSDGVRDCATALGAARDWDVFLAGAGQTLMEASGADPRIKPLLRAATRQREAAYAALSAYLEGPAFRALTVALGVEAALMEAGAGAAAEETGPFAAAVLTRRLKQVRRSGRGMRSLPIEALHELRKDCKRLRYAAEFFEPAFSGKGARRFLHRLSALQEHLGALNDAATSAVLMGQLGRAGRGYAGGMAAGMAAAAAVPARERIARSWKRFKRVGPFWGPSK